MHPPDKQPGIYQNLSNDDYHADNAVGSSGLKAFAECPAIYWYNYINTDRIKSKESNAVSLGSYAHIALLEPGIFEKEYLISPEYAIVNKGKKTQTNKAMNKAHGDWTIFAEEAMAAGKKPILHSDYMQACEMAAVLRNHKLANAMLTGGKAEVSFFAKDPNTNLTMKARPDYLVNVPNYGIVLVDYKTTTLNLGVTKQSNHAFSLGRHLQAAHHKTVTEIATGGTINEVCYIVQSQIPPYLVRIFRLPPEALDKGLIDRRLILDAMAECHTKGQWPDYPHTIEDFITPFWLDNNFI